MNSKVYWGKPCKYGHNAPRRVSNRTCTECARLRTKEGMQRIRRARQKYQQEQQHTT